jgi:tetratricopeptide (TPR) repeat protein
VNRLPLRTLLVVLAVACAAADEKRPAYKWSAMSTTGTEVSIPSGKVTILAFVRPAQAQSREALEQLNAAVARAKDARVFVVVSNGGAVQTSWPVVSDPDFVASGQFNVHVWPTVVVVTADGTEAAHVAGLRDSFAADLADYLAFAAGAFDEVALKKRLAEHEVVGAGDAGQIDRHLVGATQSIEGGRFDDAAAQLAEGLKLRPRDPRLSVLLSHVHVLRGHAADALKVLDDLEDGSIPAWQRSLLHAEALVALERWDEARPLLPEALKLNPRPADAHYLVGLVAQHDKDWEKAANAFRKAYEAGRSAP